MGEFTIDTLIPRGRNFFSKFWDAFLYLFFYLLITYTPPVEMIKVKLDRFLSRKINIQKILILILKEPFLRFLKFDLQVLVL